MLVESKVMGAYTYYIIGASVAETYSQVGFGSRSAVSHDVDTGIRIDIDESNLMSERVATVVDKSNLHASRMCDTHVKQSYLRTVERIGIVIKSGLSASHIRRTDIGATYLHATLHAQRDIGQGTQLYAAKSLASHIIKHSHLNTIATLQQIGHARNLHATHVAAYSIDNASNVDTTQLSAHRSRETSYLHTAQSVNVAKQRHIATAV